MCELDNEQPALEVEPLHDHFSDPPEREPRPVPVIVPAEREKVPA